eukprot:9425482-Pyramimonas_sp.AAC.1
MIGKVAFENTEPQLFAWAPVWTPTVTPTDKTSPWALQFKNDLLLLGRLDDGLEFLGDVGCDFLRVFQDPELSGKFLKFNLKRLRKLWLEAPT